MPKKSKKVNLKTSGISIQVHTIKTKITAKDLTRELVKKIGNNIDIKIDNDGRFNN